MTGALDGFERAVVRLPLHNKVLEFGVCLSGDAGDGLADSRFGFISSGNDGDFQRRGLNNRRIASSLHGTCVRRNAKMQVQQGKYVGFGVQTMLENAMRSVERMETHPCPK